MGERKAALFDGDRGLGLPVSDLFIVDLSRHTVVSVKPCLHAILTQGPCQQVYDNQAIHGFSFIMLQCDNAMHALAFEGQNYYLKVSKSFQFKSLFTLPNSFC